MSRKRAIIAACGIALLGGVAGALDAPYWIAAAALVLYIPPATLWIWADGEDR